MQRPASQTSARFLLAVAGLGGLLYGIDIGVIDPALSYLNQATKLSEAQLSTVVAAVLAGSILGSVIAGVLADWLGRKFMMITSGLMFVASVAVIYVSQSFEPLILGRLLQGMSGGVIAVVVPLYLAECLPSNTRGRGAAVFQFMLTLGIVLAAFVGSYYVGNAERAIALAGADQVQVVAAADHAWRSMFLAVAYPGILFLLGTLFVQESPRWLVRKGRLDAARKVLLRMRSAEECEAELAEIGAALAHEKSRPRLGYLEGLREIFTERRYVLPFILACVILGCNQATGINSLLQFMSTILQKAGLDPVTASGYGTAIKIVNSVMTIVAILLVERKGRVFLLKIGTGGIIVSLCLLAGIFYRVESQRSDVRAVVAALVADDKLAFDLAQVKLAPGGQGGPQQLSILYNYGEKQAVAEAFLSAPAAPGEALAPEQAKAQQAARLVQIARDPNDVKNAGQPLQIVRATLGPIPDRQNGMLTAACIAMFIAFFSIGPGVCVWLALSELMPTRIRSVGMGVALLVNQGVATTIAAAFLPIVGNYGFYAMFLFWAGCTVIYLLTATFFLPETKGKSLEEIEQFFVKPGGRAA